MFNKNVFTQTDVVADLIKDINEADFKAKMEALKGNQHKIDKNKNNKIDAHDFKILRGEKKVNEDQVEEAAESPFTSWKKPRQPEPSGGSGVKQGSRYGGSKQKDKPEQDDEKVKKEEIDPKKITTDTLAGVVKGKTANPFAPKKVMIDVAGNVKEEAEQLEEVGKTAPTMANAPKMVRDRKTGQMYDPNKKFKELMNKPETKAVMNRLAKEDVEQVDERELSKGETAEKERIVKGMKKSLAGFKSRYGDKAKSVMYATATARAKK
jgi:hypothetical protein